MTKYGVWNNITKRFVFGIREDTRSAAWKKFCKLAPAAARKWRYEVKVIPNGWKNPPREGRP